MMLGLGLGLPIACGGFQPTQIGGCALWLRADQGITIATGVSQWNDLSGGGHNVTQGTGTAQPTYNASDAAFGGQPTLSFAEASGQTLANAGFTVAQPDTIIIAGQIAAYGAANPEFVDGTTLRQAVGGTATNNFLFVYAGGSLVAAASGALTSPCVIGATFSGGTGTGYLNNSGSSVVSSASAGNNGITGLTVGGIAGAYLNGKIAEIVMYSRALAASELRTVFQYMGARYGIAVS